MFNEEYVELKNEMSKNSQDIEQIFKLMEESQFKQEIKNNDLYCKLKNLEAKMMLFVGIPLVMIVFTIVLILMKIS
jgi:hypothetical protein